jgi:hypothetical protein
LIDLVSKKLVGNPNEFFFTLFENTIDNYNAPENH